MMLKVLLLIALMVQVTEQLDCGTYRAESGMICHMCNPGYYKVGDCIQDGMPARCLPCPDGKYQTTCNQALSCAPCSSYCSIYYSTKVSECNKISDIKCQCDTGFHLEGDSDGKCIKHRSCPPSQGARMQGTPLSDTECEPCIPGKTYSNVSSSVQQCRNCSTCLTSVKSECTPVNDTVCAIVTVLDQHGLSTEHIIGIVFGCLVGIIIIICAAVAVGFVRHHRNHPRKPRNPDGECPQEFHQDAAPVANQVAPRIANQVVPSVASQVAPPVANDFIYRRTNEMNGDDNDIEMDVRPINQIDRVLHEEHMRVAAEHQGPGSARFPGIYSQHPDSRDETRPKENFSEAQQTERIEQGNSCTTSAASRQDQEVRHKEPVDALTPSVCRIPTDSEVLLIFDRLTQEIVKTFRTFFRFLVSHSVKHNQEMPNVDAWIEQEYGVWSSDTKEARYQLLHKWKCQRGGLDENFCKNIKKALRQSGENEVLAKLEHKFSECFPHNGKSLKKKIIGLR